MKPRILLSMPVEIFTNYAEAVELAGGVPTGDEERCDGLLLPGGGDLDPALYGQELCGCEPPDAERDAKEMALCRRFLAEKRPVFGICRGAQVIAVALGGTLKQHVENHSRLPNGADRLHEVRCAGLLTRFYGPSCTVNSSHHQAVGDMPENCRILQLSTDGVVEAFCHETLPVLAVQWHPERLLGRFARPDAVSGLPVFRAFLALCGDRV